jgi:hypothetical protein
VQPQRSGGNPRRLGPRGPKRPVREETKLKSTLMIAGGIATLLVIVPAVAIVLHSVRTKDVEKTVAAPVLTPAVRPAATATATPAEQKKPTEIEPDEIKAMVSQLAAQISQKSGYEFGPDLIDRIRARSHEYADEKGLLAARQYRREINKSFRDEGLSPLIGYILAMSRSRFDSTSSDKGIGVWRIPVSVARSQGYLGTGENSAKLKEPEVSAQIAASYSRQLLSAFDPDDFTYAIGCFGMSLQEAGQLQARLVSANPDPKTRRDINRIMQTHVLTGEQIDNIARFFAAGIVGENPQKFGLLESQPLSSLY